MRVLTLGTFDLFHVGHLNLLNRAHSFGGELVVGVNSDRFVEAYKRRPTVVKESDRLKIVQAVKGVDRALLNDGPGRDLIEQVNPSVVVVGSDWHRRDYLEQLDLTQQWVDAHGIAVAYVPRTPMVSSSQLRAVAG